LSGRGLCDELITRPEESYRLCCVVCDLETSRMDSPYIYNISRLRVNPVFLNCSTCFGRHNAHHPEPKNCNCGLRFYIRLWWPAAVMAEWELSSYSVMTAYHEALFNS